MTLKISRTKILSLLICSEIYLNFQIKCINLDFFKRLSTYNIDINPPLKFMLALDFVKGEKKIETEETDTV